MTKVIFCVDADQAERAYASCKGHILCCEEGDFRISEVVGIVHTSDPLPGSEEYCGFPMYWGVVVKLGEKANVFDGVYMTK